MKDKDKERGALKDLERLHNEKNEQTIFQMDHLPNVETQVESIVEIQNQLDRELLYIKSDQTPKNLSYKNTNCVQFITKKVYTAN